MSRIDPYSYQCGIMDCFNEMVKANVKHIALAHPFKTKKERDQYIPFVKKITDQYGTSFYLDDDPLITDLFAASLNKNTYNIIFYKNEADIQEYIDLKELKKTAVEAGHYDQYREIIAFRFGKLLTYSDQTIRHYIDQNNEKELFERMK